MIFGRYLNTMLYTPLILWLIFVDKSNASGRNLSSCRMSKKIFEEYSKQVSNLNLLPTYNTDADELPLTFDARLKWLNCTSIGDIKNQGECKSGWAVAVASVITDRLCIRTGEQHDDLSAYNLLTCCEDCCGCRGGNILSAWNYAKEEGLLTGGSYDSKKGCQPYLIRPCDGRYRYFGDCGWRSNVMPDCLSDRCSNRMYSKNNRFGNKIKIKGHVLLPRVNHELIMKELFLNGPIQVSMHLYDDLRWHETGVYVRKSGSFQGDHAVKLIGWDDERNWLLINSFGKRWGDKGTFLVPMDYEDSNCDFGYAMVVPLLKTTKKKVMSNAISYRINCKLFVLPCVFNYIFWRLS